MVAILADIIILALILGYCAYLVYGIVKRFKNGVIQGCGGSCAGCSGCGGGCCSSDPDEVKKMIENMYGKSRSWQSWAIRQALCSTCS